MTAVAAGSTLTAAQCVRVATLCKALSDPARVCLYRAIADADAGVCVCELPDQGLSQSTVSHHLRVLRTAGLVTCERRGTWVYYSTVDGGTAPLGVLERAQVEKPV